MMPKQEVVAMLLAGGQGSRLGVLTKNLAKPAVPYGGKYRIIDFPLSNCVNSGIESVGVLTQYQPLLLNEYIGSGQPWDLDSMNAGVRVLPHISAAASPIGIKARQTQSIRISILSNGIIPIMWSFCPEIISIRWTIPKWWRFTKKMTLHVPLQ